MQIVWADDLRVLVSQTMAGGGVNVRAAASKALTDNTIEASLEYLNNGLYVARELDCQATPSPAPTGGALPTTGANTSALAFGGAVLIAFGIGAVLLARRSRS